MREDKGEDNLVLSQQEVKIIVFHLYFRILGEGERRKS